MKLDDNKTPPIKEKHRPMGVAVALVDKRGRVVWVSDDPANAHGRTPIHVADSVIPDDREMVLDLLSRVVLRGETVDYLTYGQPMPSQGPVGEIIRWRVVMWPVDEGALAACCVIHPVMNAFDEITDSDRELIRHLANDCTLKEAAEKMFVSESAIDNRIKNLKKKMGVKNIGGLVAKAVRHHVV